MNTTEQRQTVQNICRDILKEIIVFCEKHDIDYFMIHGSLLGAVRHGGVIPWDDDIDIAMTRDNYYRFIDCIKADGKEILHLNDIKINGSGSADYVSEVKVGRRGTKYCPKIGEDLNINSQITVDIYCVDYLKPSYVKDIKRKNILRLILSIAKLNWNEKRFMMRAFKQGTSRFKYLRIIALYGMHVFRLLFTEKGIEHMIYNLAVDTTKSSEYMGVLMGVRQPIYFSSHFSLKKVDFDGLKVLIPSNYDEILTRAYGDYMTPPPEDKRCNLDRFETVLEIS